MGGQCSQFSPSGNGANGRKHLRLLPDSCKTAYGAGTWLSLLRPGCFYSFYRGAPENAVSQSREKPNHRCPLCTGRAVHWTPPGKYRWTDRGYDDLIADGNSVILVDHDTQILSHADWLIEMGPEAGAKGGQVIAEGTISDIVENKVSRIGAFLKPEYAKRLRPVIQENDLFEHGAISLSTGAIHTVKPLKVKIPKGRLTVVTGVSGSGKTTLILESLVPGIEAAIAKTPLLPMSFLWTRQVFPR